MTIILAGPNDYLSYELFIKKSVFTIKYLALDPTILAIDDPILREQQLLKKNKAKSGSNFNFIIHIDAVERFLHDLLESNIPFETERVKFLFQNSYSVFGISASIGICIRNLSFTILVPV